MSFCLYCHRTWLRLYFRGAAMAYQPGKNAGFLLQLSAVNADQLRYYGYFLLVLGIFFVWSARP